MRLEDRPKESGMQGEDEKRFQGMNKPIMFKTSLTQLGYICSEGTLRLELTTKNAQGIY